MNPRLALIPLAALSSPLYATTYMTIEQAQQAMFPGEHLTPSFRMLNDAQLGAIMKAAGSAPLGRQLNAWRAQSGGWLIVDQVVGKHDYITYAVALDASGAVKSVEILDYRENYGGQVRDPRWRAQFIGRRAGQPLRLDNEVRNIAGATLSSKHVTDGVRRVLATYAIVLGHAGS